MINNEFPKTEIHFMLAINGYYLLISVFFGMTFTMKINNFDYARN